MRIFLYAAVAIASSFVASCSGSGASAPSGSAGSNGTQQASPQPGASLAPAAKVAASLCIGQPSGTGLTYNLVSHDEFDQDAALNTGAPVAADLNVSDTYDPPALTAAKKTTWSDSYSFGRENGGLDGTDDSAYPSFADISTWQKEYGASKYPSTIALEAGVGVKLIA